LITISAATAGALLVYDQIRVRQRVYASMLEDHATTGADAVQSFLRPVWNGLTMIRGWAVEGDLDPSDPLQLDRRFLPIVDPAVAPGSPGPSNRLSSLKIATSDGNEYILARKGGAWSSVSSSRGEHGLQSRAWYRGAVRAGFDSDDLYWTDIDLHASESETAVTAAWAWRDGRNRTWVAALGQTRAAIDGLLTDLDLTENGFLLLTDAEGDALLLQPGATSPVATARLGGILREDHDRGRLLAKVFLARRSPGIDGSPGRVGHGGDTWWFRFRQLSEPFDNRELVLVVPASDLAGRYHAVLTPVTYALFAIIGLGVAGLIVLSFRYRRNLIGLRGDPGHVDSSEADLRALIARGESDRLEFKSTLRWNLKSNKPGKEIELAWLKTVVAYLNTDGGTLLIGVDDGGAIVGTDRDGFRNEDKFLLHVDNLIHKHVGLEFGRYLSFALRPIGDAKILVLDCRKAREPAFLKRDDEEDFYVRIGPASRRLSLSKTLEHLGGKG
jgi:hypothetical protein